MVIKKTNTGQFKKGVSGNLSGRPKTEKLTEKDRKELTEIFKSSIDKGNKLKEPILFMLKRAQLVSDVFKIVKEFAPYITAKLSSVKTEVEEVKKLEITINGKVIEKDLKVVNPKMKEIKDE